MDLDCNIGVPDASWSEETTPGSEDIEEVVRKSRSPPPHQSILYRHTVNPRSSRPIRRRLRAEEYRIKSHESFTFATTMNPTGVIGIDPSKGSPPSVMAIVNPTTSSRTNSWTAGGFVEEVEDDQNYVWTGQDDDEVGDGEEDDSYLDPDKEQNDLVSPKVEPLDDHLDMADVADMSQMVVLNKQSQQSSPPTHEKRGRGRPRKHPKPTPESMAKIAKGRTKTGCKTCRRRKKKCDEAKPGCLNCEKNGVTCEGYPERKIWKSGKEQAEEARLRRAQQPLPTFNFPAIILGVETEHDRIFFNHYINSLSLKFTVEEGGGDTAFRSVLLPVAQNDIGLMHSILSLASKHIDYNSPYGRKLLLQHPNVDEKSLKERSEFHSYEASKELSLRNRSPGQSRDIQYCQMLCLVLETLSDAQPTGAHRMHLQACQNMLRENPPQNQDIANLIYEFFPYHIYLDELIRLPARNHDGTYQNSYPGSMDIPSTMVERKSIRLLGIFDGLFMYISRISSLRNQIRDNLERNISPVVPYQFLGEASNIEAEIRAWKPPWKSKDSRELAGQLNRHMVFIYLYRTIRPPRENGWDIDPALVRSVDHGIAMLERIEGHDTSQTLLLAPTFVIGCAAFLPEQRDSIRKAIGVIKNYMEYKNSDLALEVLERVWKLMDLKDERSWDWQGIAHSMHLDFLAT